MTNCTNAQPPHSVSIIGAQLGAAVGDAIGLPYEGLSRRRGLRMLGPPERHRLLLGHGMISDDTEHTCMVAQSLVESGVDVDRFRRRLAARMRWWLLGLPTGIGLAILRAILKLWLGFNPGGSGVYSAGNGPAMRSTIIGAAVDAPALLKEFVRASTGITHTDPKAEYEAYAIALAAHLARSGNAAAGEQYLAALDAALGPQAAEILGLIEQSVQAAAASPDTPAFAKSLGQERAVSGYVYHSVPVAVHAWLGHPRDLSGAIAAVIACGGDTDTTAAMAGGMVGAAVGEAGIPPSWLSGLAEWPRSVAWMERLGKQLAAVMAGGAGAQPVLRHLRLRGARRTGPGCGGPAPGRASQPRHRRG